MVFLLKVTSKNVITDMGTCGDNAYASPDATAMGQEGTLMPNNLFRVGLEESTVVTPVSRAALDPLMHKTLQPPPLIISPTAYETPPKESFFHVSTYY
jgi:hypothetical protein